MKWVSSFSYLPINYGMTLASVKNQTQQVIFPNNLEGNKIRARFSNRYSHKPLTLWRVTIGAVIDGRVQNAGTITLDGNPIVQLGPGEEAWSDEIEYSVSAGGKIAVSVYVKEQQEIGSICILWSKEGATVDLSQSGDFTSGGSFAEIPAEDVYPFVKEDANKGMVFYGVSGVQVWTDDKVKTVAAFGDSITHMSYLTNALCKRLYAAYPGQVSLLNCGIGGNRVLHDATYVDTVPGKGSCFGMAGIKRFEEDVFGENQADVVLVLEGINDIMHPVQFDCLKEQVTPDELVKGYQKYIEIAHKHHARIFGATITPCGDDSYPENWLPVFEAIRRETNRRIREGIGFDGYFEYDAAVRDESRAGYMKKEYHIGDGLHPNDVGGAVMAGQIDLDAIMGKAYPPDSLFMGIKEKLWE